VTVVRRDEARPADVVCGLAVTDGRAVPETLPTDEERADVVLATNEPEGTARSARRRSPRRVRTLVETVWLRLRGMLAGLLAVLVVATLTIAALTSLGWWESTYVTMLTALAGANPDLQAPTAVQLVEALLVIATRSGLGRLLARLTPGHNPPRPFE
jgi:type IV secretory pathway VirB2 component (pilin)